MFNGKNPIGYSDKELKELNKTARSSGAVGKNAILPTVVRQIARKSDMILDYGAGPEAIHTMALREDGWVNAEAWEIGDNRNSPEYHIMLLPVLVYGVTFASNVLNIQPTPERIKDVIREVAKTVMPLGYALFNYPTSPRKSGMTVKFVYDALVEEFGADNVSRLTVHVTKSVVWVCSKEEGYDL